jgi:hypothetical protein
MTDDYELDGDQFTADDLLAMIQRAASRPRDVVPTKGLDRDTILTMNANVGKVVTFHDPGTVISGPDGPVGMTESRTVESTWTPPIVPRAALEAAGLTEAEVPNVRVV